jgi:hypothetical protein
MRPRRPLSSQIPEGDSAGTLSECRIRHQCPFVYRWPLCLYSVPLRSNRWAKAPTCPASRRFQSSPGLAAKVSFYGLYLNNEGQVRIWPYAQANGAHIIEVLRRLRAEIPTGKLIPALSPIGCGSRITSILTRRTTVLKLDAVWLRSAIGFSFGWGV